MFQIGWFSCVLGGDLVAIVVVVFGLIVHHNVVMENQREWMLIGIIALVGCLWDLLMINTGVLVFPGALSLGIPVWLISLWVLFATTFSHSMYWLSNHWWLAGMAAALFGPASYWSGGLMNGSQIGEPLFISVTVLALGWLFLFPCGLLLVKRART